MKRDYENPQGYIIAFKKQEVVLFIIKMERYYSFSGTENGIYPRRNREGEDIEGTSMQVEEETGVNQLRIIRKLQKTYHVFKRNGVYKLKITHWFEMQSDFEEPLRAT
jgi:hypothetical protein